MGKFFNSDHVGFLSLFCYSMTEQVQIEFRAACESFAHRYSAAHAFVSVRATNGRDHSTRHHVGFVVSNTSIDLVERVESSWEALAEGPSDWAKKNLVKAKD